VLGVAPDEEAVNAEQRYRTAHHEAGHTVMAYLLGRTVGVVSIRPCEAHLGVSFHRKARIAEHQLDRLGQPAILLPAVLRRACETEAVIALAGPTAEDLAVCSAEGGTFVNEHTPDHAQAEELVSTLVKAGLTSQEMVMLERSERTRGRSDEEKAQWWLHTAYPPGMTHPSMRRGGWRRGAGRDGRETGTGQARPWNRKGGRTMSPGTPHQSGGRVAGVHVAAATPAPIGAEPGPDRPHRPRGGKLELQDHQRAAWDAR
jgi:hypothetical protein